MVVGFQERSLTSVADSDTEEGHESRYFVVTVETANSEDMISQLFNAGLLQSLEEAGFKQPTEIVAQRTTAPPAEWRFVAPGVMVRPEEFEYRYSMFDLDAMRAKMRPEIFRAFVRSIGSIRSLPNTDVNDLVLGENS